MVHDVLEEGHVGHQQLMRSLRGFKVVGIAKREIERVPTNDPVGVDLRGVKDDLTGGIVTSDIRINCRPETIVYCVGVAVDEVNLRVWTVSVEYAKLHVELVV